jgi:hypothetical protein
MRFASCDCASSRPATQAAPELISQTVEANPGGPGAVAIAPPFWGDGASPGAVPLKVLSGGHITALYAHMADTGWTWMAHGSKSRSNCTPS